MRNKSSTFLTSECEFLIGWVEPRRNEFSSSSSRDREIRTRRLQSWVLLEIYEFHQVCCIQLMHSVWCINLGAIIRVHSFGCIQLGAVSCVQSVGFSHLGAIIIGYILLGTFTWLHLLGYIQFGAISWVHLNECTHSAAFTLVYSLW